MWFQKYLYVTLKVAVLFWGILTVSINKWDFKINPCNWFMSNKNINGKQCTILCYNNDQNIFMSNKR